MVNTNPGPTAEYSAAAELLARGIIPNWPSVEDKPYDFIAATPTNGIYRIQVKGINHKGPTVRAHVAMKNGKGKRRSYTDRDVDFVVLRLFEFDLYYVIPVKHIKKDMRLKPADPACPFHRFKNAWRLLK